MKVYFIGSNTGLRPRRKRQDWSQVREKNKEELKMMDPREVLSLSSGTISVLMGTSPNYEEIDKIQFEFYEWVLRQKKTFENWQSAWDEFQGKGEE